MPSKRSKRLVIDASIVRSCGKEDATFPTSKNCRDFLKAVLNISHQVVVTTAIWEEWRRHQSSFARKWLLSMYAKRKVYSVAEETNDELRAKISSNAPDQKAGEAMLKDCHLLEAALKTDMAIASLDEEVRILFAEISARVGELKLILWVNPDKIEDDRPIEWLEAGAEDERNRRLGSRTESD